MANSITSSNIWFAIDVDCGSTETIANMYLNDGHIRFTTDNYDPVVALSTYEDTTPVSGVWYKDALKLDGLDDTLINIDLAYGTGYSTLNGWSFSIINKCVNGSPFHKAILDTTSTYLLGSNITLYVVIDNVFYKRWVGIVSDYAITEDYFKINCDDKFIKNFNLFPKTTIGATNYPNSLEDSIGKVIPVCVGDVKYAKPINVVHQEINFKLNSSYPLARIKPYIRTGDSFAHSAMKDDDIVYGIPSSVERELAYCDVIEAKSIHDANIYYSIINGSETNICITVPNSTDKELFNNKYLTFSDSSVVTVDNSESTKNYLKIIAVREGTSPKMTLKGCKLLYLLVESSPNGITDFTQLYGDITDESIPGINDVTSDSIYVYIWDVDNQYKLSENDVTIINSNVDSEKVISEKGDITCYKQYGDGNVLSFNPLNIFKIDDHTLNIKSGVTEVYHIPDNAKSFTYDGRTSDPMNIQNLGSYNCSKVLNKTITWDDDQLDFFDKGYQDRWNWMEQSPGVTLSLNQNSMVFYNNGGFDYDKDFIVFVMNYNLSTFNPKKYNRVKPTPIWNAHATGYGHDDSAYGGDYSRGWYNTGDGNYFVRKLRCDVYGIMDSALNGKIFTASMGNIEAPVNRIKEFTKISDWYSMDSSGIVSLALPLLFSNAVQVPNPITGYTMLNLYNDFRPNQNHIHEVNNNNDFVTFGAIKTTKNGEIGYYKCYEGNSESLVLDRTLTVDSQDISENLWNMFDANGDISIALELTQLDGSYPTPQYGSTTVHLIGLTGYIEYEPSDLYLRVHGECASTTPDAFDLILTTYNGVSYVGRTNLVTYRGDWNIGRQVNEQNNSLDYINELCAQSWVVGWTNRSGNVELKAIEDNSVRHTHDDNIILRDSIKNFNLTPLTKVCNELSIEADYNAITGKYDKIYSVDNIDQASFPSIDQGVSNTIQLQNDPDYDSYTSIQCKVGTYPDYMVYAVQNTHYNGVITVGDIIRINPFKVLVYDTDSNTNLLASYYYDGNTSTSDQPPFGGVIKGTEGQSHMVVDEIILDDPTPGWTYFKCLKTSVTGVLADILIEWPDTKIIVASYFSEVTKVDLYSINSTWRSWVQGIDSYADAKDIWNTCKTAWMENKTINKYPDSLSKLSWFNNRNSFEDVTTYDETNESGYKFFKKAIEWCTRQKYKIVYQIPLTSDTIKVELMDTVNFFDPILTGYVGEDAQYLEGYITSLSCKPTEKVIEVELTAEMKYLTPSPYPVTGDIIERGAIEGIDDIDIVEDSGNVDNIIEG